MAFEFGSERVKVSPKTRPTCLEVNKSFDVNISSGPDRFRPDLINQFKVKRPLILSIFGPNFGIRKRARLNNHLIRARTQAA